MENKKVEIINSFLDSIKLVSVEPKENRGYIHSLGSFFGLNVSKEETQLKNSISILVENKEEASSLLKESINNNQYFTKIQEGLDNAVKDTGINPNDSFYLILNDIYHRDQ